MQEHLARASLRVLAVLAVAAVATPPLVDALADTRRPAGDGESVIRPAGGQASFTTVFPSPLGIEGLTGDGEGNLYSAGRGGDPCPVWRARTSGGVATVVGTIPAPCSPSGIALDSAGDLFVADGDEVYTLTPDAADPPAATVFAGGVPGANGLAFDSRGDLWVSDGTTGQGRVWRVGTDGAPAEVFRIQPMVNEVNVVEGVGGVGRDPRSLPPGTVTVTPNGRSAANTAGSQHLVANGLAFAEDGTLYVADTGRGAIWRITFDQGGNLRSPVGCDTTFTPNTLCLDNVVVSHPYLEGADGIALDRGGNIWTAANERNAIVVASPQGRVLEFFRNPADEATQLRNQGPLEFPTSPFLDGRTLCLAHSDGSRRDNFPSSGGEVGPSGPARAKISCLDQPLATQGMPLPVR
ncbi:MAG: SMP-30/gluconolactonase/LRE family protein [Streptomycetales bacterium]